MSWYPYIPNRNITSSLDSHIPGLWQVGCYIDPPGVMVGGWVQDLPWSWASYWLPSSQMDLLLLAKFNPPWHFIQIGGPLNIGAESESFLPSWFLLKLLYWNQSNISHKVLTEYFWSPSRIFVITHFKTPNSMYSPGIFLGFFRAMNSWVNLKKPFLCTYSTSNFSCDQGSLVVQVSLYSPSQPVGYDEGLQFTPKTLTYIFKHKFPTLNLFIYFLNISLSNS